MDNNVSDKYEVIVGGGPVGCYLAYKLLTVNPNKQVVLFEKKLFERPQVIRIPFIIANDLPLDVKNKMWSDMETRTRIFNPGSSIDRNFWPKPNYSFWPWINISALQTALIEFLKIDPLYKERFYFIPDYGSITKNTWQTAVEKAYPQFNTTLLSATHALFCTCGGYAKTLRHELNTATGKPPEFKGHGIYLIYQNKKVEDYIRNSRPISYIELGESGISYAAANNTNRDVQLYTYPEGELAEVFADIPQEFMKRAAYKQNSKALDLSGNGLVGTMKKWFERYQTVVLKTTKKFDIALPDDLSRIQVFYASRMEYYWNDVAIEIPWQSGSRPLFFLGDSAGSTDYKSGLSMGRGLLAVQELSQLMMEHSDDFAKIISRFQTYWNNIIRREFNKGPKLPIEPWIQYHRCAPWKAEGRGA